MKKENFIHKRKRNLRQIIILIASLMGSILITSCEAKPNNNNETTITPTTAAPTAKENQADNLPISKSSFKLNTIVTVTIYDSTDTELLDECINLCDYYEGLFSRTKANSEIAMLNADTGGSYTISEPTAELIKEGLNYCELSGGAFDISIAPLTALWNFSGSNKSVPAASNIKEALSHIGYQYISLKGSDISFADTEMSIDLGAIAKGYIADRIKDLLIENGVNSAIIDLGGNILLVGSKPDGSDFRIGIQKPFEDRQERIATLQLSDVSIVSSGIYERYFIENDTLYHHILNPTDGYPYDNDLISVTIISNRSVDGDGLSTTVFALGLEKGLELINTLKDTYAVFITSDYELHYSNGFMENIPTTLD